MEFKQYTRKPFSVEAVEITEDNFDTILNLVGSSKAKEGNHHTKEGDVFIDLDRQLIPRVRRAYIGWYLTRLGAKYRCYSPILFNAQFIEDEETTLVDDELDI